MNEKQQQLLFDKGITNLPSDALCSDNTLSNAENLIYRDGEHRVIQKPAQVTGIDFSGVGKLLLVHHVGNGSVKYISHLSNYIYSVVDSSNKTAINDTPISGTPTASVCGNFLIIKDNNGTRYYLWKDDVATHDGYVYMGQKLQEPSIDFCMGPTKKVSHTIAEDGILNWTTVQSIALHADVADGKQEAYNNMVIGAYAKNQKTISQDKRFCEPFLACVAVELYDGSFVLQSAPQLLFPSVRKNTYVSKGTDQLTMFTACNKLFIKATFDYSSYSDIVKDVVLFITNGAKLYDTTVDQTPTNAWEMTGSSEPYTVTAKVYHDTVNTALPPSLAPTSIYRSENVPTDGAGACFFPLCIMSDTEVLNQVRSNGIFYKLCSLGIVRSGVWVDTTELIEKHTLENITTQQQLPIDYFSHCSLSADTMKVLNQRLHLGGVYRGYAPITGNYFHYETGETYDIYVEISTSNGTRLIKQSVTLNGIPGFYFYYPDPRAKKAYIVNGSYQYIEMTLEEHPSLNGAYYLKGLPTGNDSTSFTRRFTSQENNTPERLYNQLYVSEANNPFVFRPDGVVAVGVGNVIELASTTHALSEGQFGQFPLVVFTSEGMWALSMDSTGVYKTAHPMSREVILSNSKPLETDGAIFFASEKGLMEVVGSQVKCVSEQLSGRMDEPFAKFLKTAFMAYDYRDSLIWIFDGATHSTGQDTVIGSRYCWVYSMKSGTFGRFDFGTNNGNPVIVTNAVSNYPDYLLQVGSNIYTLTGRSNINSDSSLYSAKLVTRPLKLENALALKTIMQARHITDMKPQQTNPPTMTWQVEASNNMETWITLSSLTGKPWKYYRFTYTFSNLRATDTFAGTVLITQERRTNKLR